MTKRLGCKKCSYYSYGLQRCTIGKINPPTIKGALSAIPWMGLSYICDKDGMLTKVMTKLTKERGAI